MINYGFAKQFDSSFDEIKQEVTEALAEHGFGILTEIDVRKKFKEKLDIDFRKYVILGACNPSNAYKAILAEENIGLLLPCNVILYEKDGKIIVSVIRPTVAMQTAGNDKLRQIAENVESDLKAAFDSISEE
jgi:uncharacterized protein (DUF302 family)